MCYTKGTLLTTKKGSIMKKLPILPEGYFWNVDTHRNVFMGVVTGLYIYQRVTKSLLGFSYQGKRLVAHSVVFADDSLGFERETKDMAEKIS